MSFQPVLMLFLGGSLLIGAFFGLRKGFRTVATWPDLPKSKRVQFGFAAALAAYVLFGVSIFSMCQMSCWRAEVFGIEIEAAMAAAPATMLLAVSTIVPPLPYLIVGASLGLLAGMSVAAGLRLVRGR